MKKGLVAKVYAVKVLPNTIEELVKAIYLQTGTDKIFLPEALEMADFLERERYEKIYDKPPANRFGKPITIHKVK
jgi:predicted metal-dependent hydrolase